MLLLCGLPTGAKHGFSPSWRSKICVSLVMQDAPLSVRTSMTTGAQGREPPFYGFEQQIADIRAADFGIHHGAPSDDLAVIDVDKEDATDDIAFQQLTSNPSLHQRRFERIKMTLRS